MEIGEAEKPVAAYVKNQHVEFCIETNKYLITF
jgi:hypothetical protein